MAFEVPGHLLGTLRVASTAFSTKQYHFMVASSSEGIAITPSDSAPSMTGIMQTAPTVAGEAVTLMTDGVSKCRYDTALAVGDNYIIGASGRAASTAGAAAGALIMGKVLLTGASSAIGTVQVERLGITT